MVEDGYLVKIRIGRHVTHSGGGGAELACPLFVSVQNPLLID
jgi:hypothetical protein